VNDLIHDQQLYRAAQRAAQREAKSLLKALRRAHAEKAKARRVRIRRTTELGEAVLTAGCAEWSVLEVHGALLEAVERFGHSPTQRVALRQRAEAALLGGKASSNSRAARLDTEAKADLTTAMFGSP
jgi:Conjugal transfer protein TraD